MTSGALQLHTFSKQERMHRALKIWGLCWGIACLCVLIPIAHFVLVPAAMITGPILGLKRLGVEQELGGGTGNCPSCQKEMKIAVQEPIFPLNDVCEHCHSAVEISSSISIAS